MPSRGEMRRVAEGMLRAGLLAVLGVALWRSRGAVERRPSTRVATLATLNAVIARALSGQDPLAIDVDVDATPSREQRDVLVALRRSGVAVRWHGAVPALAIEAVGVREPDARARVMVASADSASIVLSDAAGVLDTVRAASGVTIDAGALVGPTRAAHGRYIARATALSMVPRRAVMVLGRAGWESKFVMSALGEAGWIVRARVPAAPGVDVTDEALLPLDTARYDAVVVLDSSAAPLASAIARFVADGGGLVVSAGALSVTAVGVLSPAVAGERRAGRILLAEDSLTPPDLPVRLLESLRRDAVALEHSARGITVAARRAGLGRVLLVGYDDSWRWRMLGGANGQAAHRAWWSQAVGSVSRESPDVFARGDGDAAPRAALIDALGSPSPPTVAGAVPPANPLPLSFLLFAVLAALAEITSRRFRGVP